MNIRKCLIVEDDSSCVEILKTYLDKLPFFNVVGQCVSQSEAIAFLASETVDLIFLDLHLDNVEGENADGLDLLQTIKSSAPIIITTSYPDFAVESYRIGKAIDYLVKPFEFNRFLMAINRALGLQLSARQILDKDYIFLKMGRHFQKFKLADIDYLQAYGIYLKVITNGVTHVVNDTISNLEETLDNSTFMRVHKSYIINVHKINKFNRNHLFLEEDKIPIGISYKPKLKGLLSLFNRD